MTYTETVIPGVWIIEPKVLKDARGYFMEAFKQAEFEEHIGKIQFVQDNESCSSKGVLRGLHYQLAPYSQSKLILFLERCLADSNCRTWFCRPLTKPLIQGTLFPICGCKGSINFQTTKLSTAIFLWMFFSDFALLLLLIKLTL